VYTFNDSYKDILINGTNMCISTGPFELVEVVQVFRLTTVIFVTELTVMIK
jgi:hypothetical protein